MKDIKSYVIGFLTCACLFLIMGQSEYRKNFARYQAFEAKSIFKSSGNSLWILKTATGELYEFNDRERKWFERNRFDIDGMPD